MCYFYATLVIAAIMQHYTDRAKVTSFNWQMMNKMHIPALGVKKVIWLWTNFQLQIASPKYIVFNIPHLFSRTDSFFTVTVLMLVNTQIPYTLLPHLLGLYFLTQFSVDLLNLDPDL